MLLQKQFLIEFQYQKDITHLSKNSDNGTQNLIDPYSIFQQPLDYFMTGSEYAVFNAGNYSRFAAGVKPQNHYLLEVAFLYGLNDSVNTGIKIGYNSHSKLNHFTLNDLVSRLYKFNAYYYFDFICDWRITKNSLLSLKTHFVPNYTNYLQTSNYAPEYKTRNRYVELSLVLQILF